MAKRLRVPLEGDEAEPGEGPLEADALQEVPALTEHPQAAGAPGDARLWMRQLSGGRELENVDSWGRLMALDTRLSVHQSDATARPSLAEMRLLLLERSPQTGPIFA